MLIVSPSLVISGDNNINGNSPMLCWHNLVTFGNVAATFENDDAPAVNLANPATDLLWKSTSLATQYITIDPLGYALPIDYVGVSRHNFGSGSCTLSIEADSGSGFQQLTSPSIPGDDEPIVFRFPSAVYATLRLKIVPTTTLPYAAVMFVGRATLLQRRLYVGHTPIKFGRTFDVTTGISENGNFLGRVVKSETRSSSIELQNLSPDWYRDKLDPFIASHAERTFFWAWRPQSYPLEVGYCWVMGNPQPRNARGNGMMEISIPIGGIAV